MSLRRDGRGRWIVLFGLLLCGALAAPALADPPEGSSPPAPSSTLAEELPSAQQVANGLAEVERAEAERQAELGSSAAIAERAESQQAFAGISSAEARELFVTEFAEQLEDLNSDPARYLSEARLDLPLADGTAAVVTADAGPELLEAGIPVEAENDKGVTEKVNLSIVEGAGEGFELANPLTAVTMPEAADEGIEVGEEGLTIAQADASEDSTAEPLGDRNLFYPSAQTDTDLVVSPVAEGVELSDQLRSSDSPEMLRFEVGVPAGAELREDGHGGAEVVSGDRVLANVPFPTAVDAQGVEVPVELTVEGDELILVVQHSSSEFAYPIDVDPSLVEDWYNNSWYSGANLQALSDGSWGFASNAGWIYGSTSCIWACWGSERGLYVAAESGEHGSGEQGQWAYGPPGTTSWITNAEISPFWRENYANCPKSKYGQPHDYDGLWSPEVGWDPVETDQANDAGYADPSGYGKAVIIGLGNAGASSDKCRRVIMAGGVAIWITDGEPPTWNSAPSVADEWIDTAPTPVYASASDPGLGVKYFNLWTTNPSTGANEALVGNAVNSCSGLHASPCPSSWSSAITNYNPAALPTGILGMDTVAYDALGIEHNSSAGPIFLKVDHLAPEISYSGELLSEHPIKYHLSVTGTDGNSGSLATAQSGMKSLQFYVDGVLAGRDPETASPPACSNIQQGRNVGSCQFANVPLDLNRTLVGKHTLKIVAIDSLNHVSEKTIELNLPADTTAPALTPTGSLYASSGGWVDGGEQSVTASATDAETGVVEEALYVDGTRTGSAATQECFYGGCSLSHTFALNWAGYAQGAHTVKLIAKDGGGKVSEKTWTVKLDTVAPTLESISAPEVPAGWTPQLSSFHLNYAAADAGAGIKKIEVLRPGVGGTNVVSSAYSNSCTATAASPCPTSVEGTATISTINMAQGADTVSVKAYDAFEHVSGTKTFVIRVDRDAPTVSPVGPLFSASSSTLLGVVTRLNLGATDAGSGVESVEIQLDGKLVEAHSLTEILAAGGSQACSGESCELNYSYSPIVGEAVAPGHHTVKLLVSDKAGHVTSVSHEVTLDTRPPELKLSGPLAETVGEPLPSQIADLFAEANDGEGEYSAGLANLRIEVDGNEVDYEPTAPTGGVAQEHIWVVDQSNNRVEIFDGEGEFLRSFGGRGASKGEFSHPAALALDGNGSLWVADAGNNRIEEFTEKGQFRRAIGSLGEGHGQFDSPEGLAVDANGDVFVADTGNARIQEFNSKGEFIRTFGTFGTGNGQMIEPTALTIGPNGNVWVGDWGGQRVEEFTATGTFVRAFGSEGTGNGQFRHPDAILVDGEENVWVGDQNNERIQEFSEHGEYETQFGAAGSGQGQFSLSSPMGIAVGPNGTMWVSDTGNNRIQQWDPGHYETTGATPAFASSFGSAGSGAGQFSHPAGSAVDAKGNIWVVDQNHNRVEKFNEYGEYLSSFGSAGSGNGQLSLPADVAVDAKGNIWVADTGNNRVEEFNEKGEYLAKFGTLGSGNLQFENPEALSVDAKGNIWVADTYNSRIEELNEKGEFVRKVGSSGTGNGQMVEPTGIAVGPNGNVWVADWGGQRLEEFSETGTFVRNVGSEGTGEGKFRRPDVVEVDARGDVWVGDQNNERVQEFNEQGEVLGQFGSAGSGQGQFNFSYPMGITADKRGRLWVTDTGNNRVQRWQIPNWGTSNFVSSFGSSGSSNGQFSHPAGGAVDAKNDLWVVDQSHNRLEEFNEKSEFLTSFGSAGSGNGQLSSPTDVAIDPKGDLWVTDTGNNRIEEFNAKGEYLAKFGTAGTGNLQFESPEAIAIDGVGHVFVADTYNSRIEELNERGEFVKAFGSPGTGNGQMVEPTGVAVGPNGNVWIADWGAQRIEEFSGTGTFVHTVGSEGSGNAQFRRPDVIEVDAHGNVWVGDQNNNRLEEFTEKGEFLGQFGGAGSGAGQFSFSYPMGITADKRGRLWISDTGNNRVERWQVAGWPPSFMASLGSGGGAEGKFSHPAGLAVGMTRGCTPPGCPSTQSATYEYDEGHWGTDPHEVVVTATDAAGNTETRELHVNEPLNVVAPNCPSATPEQVGGGETLSGSAAVASIESALPNVLETSEPVVEEVEQVEQGTLLATIHPEVTRNPEGVSIDEQGIDVTASVSGGGVEDEAGGSFTVGQSLCMQPLQEGTNAKEPMVVEGAAVVYPDSAPDTDTVIRPTALGTTIVERLRGSEAPEKFRWALNLQPDEEVVELANGDLAVVNTNRPDPPSEPVPTEPPEGWGAEESNSVEVQREQAEHDLAQANNEVEGELVAVIDAPEVVLENGEVVKGLLRVGPGEVIKAELPPGTFAKAEALIIQANPAAQAEDICTAILASKPQYWPVVCASDLPPVSAEEQVDLSEPLNFAGLYPNWAEPLRSEEVAHASSVSLESIFEHLVPGVWPAYEQSTPEEKAMCLEDFTRCRYFFEDGAKAVEIEEKTFNGPAGSQETKANAFRHSVWVAFMEVTFHDDWDGLTWAEAHEGGEYENEGHPARRKASQMDMLNDHVGWHDGGQHPAKQLTACTDMLSLISRARFMGREPYPYQWVRENDWEANLPVFRMYADDRPVLTGGEENPTYKKVIYRNGRTCPEVWGN